MTNPCASRAILATAALLLASPWRVSAVNLVSNPSFETSAPIQYAGGVLPAIPNWTVSGQRVEIITEGASDGSYGASFDNGTGASSPASGTHSAVLSQTIATTPGTAYTLMFDYGSAGNSGFPQKLNAQVSGASTIVNQTISLDVNPFGTHPINFVANSTATTIRFADATSNGENGTADGILDNVQVNANNPALLNIVNPSFESFDVPGPAGADITTLKRYPGWIIGGSGGLLIDDTDNARIQSGKAGTQFLQFNNTAVSATASQVLTRGAQFDSAYTFTVGIGVGTADFNAGYISRGATMELLAIDSSGNLTLLGSKSIAGATINATPGTMLDYTLRLPAYSFSSALDGEQLVMRLTSLSPGGPTETLFDNVQLTETLIPEPSTVLLLVAGGAVVLARRSRLA